MKRVKQNPDKPSSGTKPSDPDLFTENAPKAKKDTSKDSTPVQMPDPPYDVPEQSPEEKKKRRELAKLTREALEDDVIGILLDLGTARKKITALEEEVRKRKEEVKSYQGDKDQTIRNMQKIIDHKSSEMWRANEKASAAMRQVYVLKKQLKKIEGTEIEI